METNPELGMHSNTKSSIRRMEAFFGSGTICVSPLLMKTKEQMVTMQQMKDALAKLVGSKFPLKITLVTGDEIIRYLRGFADAQRNVLLISENAYTLAMKIIEVREIATVEFASPEDPDEWRVLRAKWLNRPFRVL